MKAAVDASAMAVEVNARKLGAPLFGGAGHERTPDNKEKMLLDPLYCMAHRIMMGE